MSRFFLSIVEDSLACRVEDALGINVEIIYLDGKVTLLDLSHYIGERASKPREKPWYTHVTE